MAVTPGKKGGGAKKKKKAVFTNLNFKLNSQCFDPFGKSHSGSKVGYCGSLFGYHLTGFPLRKTRRMNLLPSSRRLPLPLLKDAPTHPHLAAHKHTHTSPADSQSDYPNYRPFKHTHTHAPYNPCYTLIRKHADVFHHGLADHGSSH